MNLLIRITLFIARLAFTILVKLIVAFIRLLWPFLLAVLRILGSLVSTSLTATVHGPSQFTERLASEWTRRLLDLGVSRDHLDHVHSLCRFLAVSMIVLGWVVTVLFTVAILRVVFGFFI